LIYSALTLNFNSFSKDPPPQPHTPTPESYCIRINFYFSVWGVLEFIIRKQTGMLILKVLNVATLLDITVSYIKGGANFVRGSALTKESSQTDLPLTREPSTHKNRLYTHTATYHANIQRRESQSTALGALRMVE
jgi:hypothetical protein